MFDPQACSWERFARICVFPHGGCVLHREDQPLGVSPWIARYLADVCDRLEDTDDTCHVCGGTQCVPCADLPPSVEGWEPCGACCSCMQAWRDVRDSMRGDDCP